MLLPSVTFLLAASLSAASASQNVGPPNAAPGIRYLGSRICAGCHMAIYKTFVKTAMGYSAARMPDGTNLVPSAGITVYSRELDRYYRVFQQGSETYQSEYALGADGKELFRTTQKIAYSIGALENGNTYVVRRGNRLFEAPLTYYASVKKWALSPGYEQKDSGFSRPVALACVSCHTGQPKPVTGAPDGTYEDPPFAELSISCESCHGPGALHIQQEGKGASGKESLIVNPAKLPGWLADNICMNCHEVGAARIVRPGKAVGDFRPGTPLDETVSIFATRKNADESDATVQVLSHFQGMTASACYRQSGKMSCITCHDPHVEPARAYDYRPKCLTCHTINSCKLPGTTRQATTPADNCLQCHMPKRAVATIAHSALTDHRILRQTGETVPDIPDKFAKETGLLHLSAEPGQTPVAQEILFRAYTEALQTDPSLKQKWGELLRTLMSNGTDDPYVLAQAGTLLVQRYTSQDELDAGRKFLTAAVAGRLNLPGIYVVLAKSFSDTGDVSGAINALQTGISVDPTNADAYRSLIQLYADARQFEKAAETGKRYLEEFPQDTDMRNALQHLP